MADADADAGAADAAGANEMDAVDLLLTLALGTEVPCSCREKADAPTVIGGNGLRLDRNDQYIGGNLRASGFDRTDEDDVVDEEEEGRGFVWVSVEAEKKGRESEEASEADGWWLVTLLVLLNRANGRLTKDTNRARIPTTGSATPEESTPRNQRFSNWFF